MAMMTKRSAERFHWRQKRKHRLPYFSTRRWTIEKLLPEIREAVEDIRAEGKYAYFTKEALGKKFRAKIHLVEQCLHLLNLEGLVSQPLHHVAHDHPKNPIFPGCFKEWQPDLYEIRRDD